MSHETLQNVDTYSHGDQKINVILFDFSFEDINTCRSGILQEILRINEKRRSQLASVKNSPLTVSYIINEFKLLNNLSLTAGLLEDERKLIEEYKSILVSIISAKLQNNEDQKSIERKLTPPQNINILKQVLLWGVFVILGGLTYPAKCFVRNLNIFNF